jgi:hypothetical protein
MKNSFNCLSIFFLATSSSLLAHKHFAVGIVDLDANGVADAGEPLRFVDTTPVGKIFRLLPRPVGQVCGAYYMLDESARTLYPTDAFSIIALSNGDYEELGEFHAHTGAWIWAEITQVRGPAGANFGFWESYHASNSDTPSVSFSTQEETTSHAFVISEGIDDELEDPSGHIHGRAWTADRPGDYFVSIRLVDLSSSGPGGGPWHLPSETYIFHFKAGPDFQPVSARVPGVGQVLTWPSQMGIWDPYQKGIEFTVERSTSLHGDEWQPIGRVVGGIEDRATFIDPTPPAQKAFYRLSYGWSRP